MSIRSRFWFTLLTVFMVFAYSAMNTAPALADGETPPVDTSASESQPVAEPVTETLPQLPENTELVVLDEAGENIPLATQEASEVLVEGDPMWCPTGVAPKANTGGCSPSFTSFNDDGTLTDTGLVAWLNSPVNASATNKAGVIWVAYNYAAVGGEGGDIVIDGSLVGGGGTGANMETFALTIQGGWNGIDLSKLLNTTDPYSYFQSSFSIINWTGAITLNNIVMDTITTNNVSNNQALNINTKGNIILNNVTAQNSTNSDVTAVMSGAVLDNTSGTGTVTINNSDFLNNEGDGVVVNSKGAITINGLVANDNGGDGANLTNNTVQAKTVTLKGFKQFNGNGEHGLAIYSSGMITLSTIVANDNVGNGFLLDNRTSTANAGITLGGTNFAMNNGGNGMEILSHGAIAANNLNASSNDGAGAILDNCDLNISSDCIVVSAKTVKLTGVNIFNDNGSTVEGGLTIVSMGAISVSNLTASGNLGDGAYLDNEWTNTSLVDSTGTLTLTGYGFFQNNSGNGLAANSYGNILLNNIDGSFNGEDGLDSEAMKLSGGSSITLNGINSFYGNSGNGLDLLANGIVTLNNVTANFNGGAGAAILNQINPLKPYNITLKGTNTFNENDLEGLVAVTYGSILINNLTANTNLSDGVYLSNCDCIAPKTITITGYINVSNNSGSGLYIDANGPVTLINIIAESNGLNGVYIVNNYIPTMGQAVTLKGSNTFNYNGTSGLSVESYGAITINSIAAFDNGVYGAYLVNSGGTKPANITLTGTNVFVHNYSDGLYFDTSGSAVLSSINTSGNGWDVDPGNGVSGTAGGSITLTCLYTTNHIQGSGYNLTGTSVTIKGLYSKGNVNANVSTPVAVITYPCALP